MVIDFVVDGLDVEIDVGKVVGQLWFGQYEYVFDIQVFCDCCGFKIEVYWDEWEMGYVGVGFEIFIGDGDRFGGFVFVLFELFYYCEL